tara:strand:+ start:204 stop:743 length:540 start_codon:yes stop_codon:yes gene_type:complete
MEMSEMGKIKDRFFDEINSDDDSAYEDWKSADRIIRDVWEHYKEVYGEMSDTHHPELNEAIWGCSTGLFPGLEIQVVIDGADNLHWSVGSPGYVDFPAPPIGMKLPIKCWIHTHPFGSAYFSGTDWKTIDTWRIHMRRAEVLGHNEWGIWDGEAGHQYTHIRLTDDENLLLTKIGSEEE